MKIRKLPLLLSSALAATVVAPAALAVITLNGTEIASFSVMNNGADIEITTVGGNPDPDPDPGPDPDPAPDPGPDPDPDPAPDPGNCSAESLELVTETLNWVQPPGQTVIDIPRTDTISNRFTTTSDPARTGLIAVVATTGTGYVTRNMWISTCPGGEPVPQTRDGCEDRGTEAAIGYSQGVETRSSRTCMLEPNTTYYINYSNEGCNATVCTAFRNTYQ